MWSPPRDSGSRTRGCASSVAAYSPAPKDRRTKEGWRAGGIRGSHYSVDKAAQERLLDGFAKENPDIVVARLRPALMFSAGGGSEVGRAIPWDGLLPRLVPRKPWLPLLAIPKEMVFQAVHTSDVADAYWRVVERKAEGAFNIAAEPVIDPNALAWILNARPVRRRSRCRCCAPSSRSVGGSGFR